MPIGLQIWKVNFRKRLNFSRKCNKKRSWMSNCIKLMKLVEQRPAQTWRHDFGSESRRLRALHGDVTTAQMTFQLHLCICNIAQYTEMLWNNVEIAKYLSHSSTYKASLNNKQSYWGHIWNYFLEPQRGGNILYVPLSHSNIFSSCSPSLLFKAERNSPSGGQD